MPIDPKLIEGDFADPPPDPAQAADRIKAAVANAATKIATVRRPDLALVARTVLEGKVRDKVARDLYVGAESAEPKEEEKDVLHCQVTCLAHLLGLYDGLPKAPPAKG